MQKIYFFHWPSNLGGADTRLKELIQLFALNKEYQLFCVPNHDNRLLEIENIEFLKKNNVTPLSWDELPKRSKGFAISFCNFLLFSEKWRIEKIKSMGLKFIWSNDMTWRKKEEIECINENLIDYSIYTSKEHLKLISTEVTKSKTIEKIIPNYFHIENYTPIKKSKKDYFTIGKHSRTDMLKFSNNFPQFYENLELKNPRYRVMGINDKFKKRFESFDFSEKWELLKPCEENVSEFLSSLDIYVYDAHDSFIETHCRATVEAMLLEIPVVAPNKPNFKKQILNSVNGFLWNSYEECKKYCQLLQNNNDIRNQIAKSGRIVSNQLWCNKELNLKLWNEIIQY